MKIALLLSILLFPVLSHAGIINDPLLKQWSVVTAGEKGGNSIESYERKIITPYSRYTVAQVTLTKMNYEGERNLEDIRSFLKQEFKLIGLRENKFKEATRFEGYRPDINRQVVLFVSFEDKKIKVAQGFFRPMYGKVVQLEVEYLTRKFHSVKDRVVGHRFSLPFISDAYAQTDCTKCSGNPMCLLLCRSANSGSNGSFNIPGLDLSGIESQLQGANSQLNALNANIDSTNLQLGGINTNWGNTNVQIGNANQNWSATNTQINSANQNWANTNNQLNNFNNNYANTNAEIANFNQNFANTNAQIGVFNQNHAETNAQLQQANNNLVNLNATIDQKSEKALQESQAWHAMTEKESTEWRNMMKEQTDRGLAVAEKMSDPKHLFKMATYSAAGAVLGATVMNLAISGVTSAVSFLYKWATGELHEMKQQELIQEFNKAMKVYDDSSKIAKQLEASIDSVLANMTLHKKFELENSEVLANIQKYIIETEFQIEDAKKDRCVDELVPLNQKLTEFQSLAKILDMADPQKQMCLDMKEMFRKLAEIEGVLQNARPNLIKAEEALIWQKAREQNQGSKIYDEIKKGKLADKVQKTQEKQRQELYDRNVKDSENLAKDIVRDCRESFSVIRHDIKRKDLQTYCETLIIDKKASSPEGIEMAFPNLAADQKNAVFNEFKKKYIPMGLDKYNTYRDQRDKIFADFDQSSGRHFEEITNLKDRLNMDPSIALNEMKAINDFIEKLMKEQAYIYTDGMRTKRAKFEEACQSIN